MRVRPITCSFSLHASKKSASLASWANISAFDRSKWCKAFCMRSNSVSKYSEGNSETAVLNWVTLMEVDIFAWKCLGAPLPLSAKKMKNEVTRKKLVIVGDGACGKTSLLTTFSRGFFPTEYVPTIFENSVVTVKVDDTLIELELWDTAGQEDFDRLRPFSYANTDVVLIAFSVDNVASLESVQREVRSFWGRVIAHFFFISGFKKC